jgi:capsular polysaccharide export protein
MESQDSLDRLTAIGLRRDQALLTSGFSARKRQILKQWLVPWQLESKPSSVQPHFVWGAHTWSEQQDQVCIRVEDGMIRSVGLGADLVQPLSLVFDTRGIYFDATRPSDLEWLLKNSEFNAHLLNRAASFRERLVSLNVTKYNLKGAHWHRPEHAKHVVLVAGQVETDASIKLGSAHVHTNLELLESVRRMRPNSYILYKPHPDVEAGLRAGTLPEQMSTSANTSLQKHTAVLYDEVLTQASIANLYSQVDEVHVISSLSGLEAMLRGLKVVCHGMPFYVGWGLCEAPFITEDVQSRRGRNLPIDALVATVFFSYASYRNPRDGSIWSAEQALDELVAQTARSKQQLSRWAKLKRKVLAFQAKLLGYF